MRKVALEYMTSLSEAKLSMVKKTVVVIIRGCLGGIGELGEGNINVWNPMCMFPFLSEDSTVDLYLACTTCIQAFYQYNYSHRGKTILLPVFQSKPSMLASYD